MIVRQIYQSGIDFVLTTRTKGREMLDEEGQMMLARGMDIDLRLAYKTKKTKLSPAFQQLQRVAKQRI